MPTSPSKIGRRAGHALGGEQGGEDAVARRVGEGAALPHAQLAGARLPQGHVADAGQSQRVRRPHGVEAEQLAGGGARRTGAVGDVIETVLAQAGRVAQPALDLVGQHGRRDEGRAAGLHHVADRQHGRQVVAGMGRLQ